MTLSMADVDYGYRFILGREPEDAQALAFHVAAFPTVAALRSHLLVSPEFQQLLWALMGEVPADAAEQALHFAADKLVFLHLPKTAGLTLTGILDSNFPPEQIFPNPSRIDHYPAGYVARHRLFRGHYSLRDIAFIPGPARVFTVLREPRRRILSQYHFYKAHRAPRPLGAPADTPDDPIIAKARLPLKAYLRDPEIRSHVSYDNLQTRALFHLTPEVVAELGIDRRTLPALARDPPRELMLAVAKHNLRRLDAVGIAERFDETVQMLAGRYGLRLPDDYDQHNITSDLAELRPEDFVPVTIKQPDAEAQALLDDLVAQDEALYALGVELLDQRLAEQAPPARREAQAGRKPRSA